MHGAARDDGGTGVSGAGREGRSQGEMRWGKVRLSLGLSAGVVRGGARARRGGARTRKGRTVVKLHSGSWRRRAGQIDRGRG